jgi:hypothetical protein
MSITNGPFQKAAPQLEAIFALRALLQTDHIKGMQTAPSSDDVPIEVLADLWLLRFGDAWVDQDSICQDDFFRNAFIRLRQRGYIQQHFLTDRAKYVCRKP